MDRAATAPRNRNAAAWSQRWRPPHAPSERAPVGQNVLPLRRDGKRRFGGQLTVLLGGLLLATCALILASSFVGDVVFLHRVLSLILLAAAMVYGVRLWFRQPGAVNLWSIFLLSSIVAFAGAGIVGPDDTTRSNA